jgi:hypothetical protein
LPSGQAPRTGSDVEVENLMSAERFLVAQSLDELLTHAPRRVVSVGLLGDPAGTTFPEATKFTRPTWDDDVAATFNTRLPLEHLVEAAESDRLPDRLRRRVAQAAFARSVVLKRTDAGTQSARVLQRLVPALRPDLDRYLRASGDDERNRMGTLILLRTPGLSAFVIGGDTDYSYRQTEPARSFRHGLPRNWWCPLTEGPPSGAAGMILGAAPLPFPSFVTEMQRSDAQSELEALTAAGEPREFLTAAAISWALERRFDPDAAEALALAIDGWRWSPCTYGTKSDLPRRAFVALHRQFPGSEWARRTKYWYE